jgi:hypothetical protein
MARWTPNDNEAVAPPEHIGRRLFDEPKLSGAPDQRPFHGLLFTNFEETRSGGEFSVDRLGRTSVEKAVVRYLSPRAHAQGTKFTKPKAFDGWYVAPARRISPPFAWPANSPDRGRSVDQAGTSWSESDLEHNRYHAHVQMPEGVPAYDFALQIREQFVTHGNPYPISQRRRLNLKVREAWTFMQKQGSNVVRVFRSLRNRK